MPAGWYSDPMQRHELRWFDGERWTTTVSDRGVITVDTPDAAPTGGTPHMPASPTQRRNGPLLAGAAIGVAALVVVAVLATRGDDAAAPNDASSTSITAPASTAPATTSTPGATTTSAVPDVFDSAALMAAMPTAADVPSTWEQTAESRADPEPEPTGGYCGGPDAIARAITLGATGRAWGPAWHLPDGGHAGVDAYAFPDSATARRFIEATGEQASSCTDAPISFTAGEAEVDFLADDMGDDFVWDAIEASDATEGQFAEGTATMRATIETRYATSVSGQACTVNVTSLVFYEQYGSVVMEYWMDGEWGHTGLGGEPDYAHHPTQSELDQAVAVIRPTIDRRLSTVPGV